MNIIEVKDLSLTLGKTDILKHINVSFEAGKIHGLIGRNGSGKTMLMKCICGFIKPTHGEVTVDGKRVGRDVDFPKDMGIIIETPGFIPYYSGYKNLKLLAGLNHKIGKEEVRNSMKQVGLDPDLKRHVRKYSLGMRQRLGLAAGWPPESACPGASALGGCEVSMLDIRQDLSYRQRQPRRRRFARAAGTTCGSATSWR